MWWWCVLFYYVYAAPISTDEEWSCPSVPLCYTAPRECVSCEAGLIVSSINNTVYEYNVYLRDTTPSDSVIALKIKDGDDFKRVVVCIPETQEAFAVLDSRDPIVIDEDMVVTFINAERGRTSASCSFVVHFDRSRWESVSYLVSYGVYKDSSLSLHTGISVYHHLSPLGGQQIAGVVNASSLPDGTVSPAVLSSTDSANIAEVTTSAVAPTTVNSTEAAITIEASPSDEATSADRITESVPKKNATELDVVKTTVIFAPVATTTSGPDHQSNIDPRLSAAAVQKKQFVDTAEMRAMDEDLKEDSDIAAKEEVKENLQTASADAESKHQVANSTVKPSVRSSTDIDADDDFDDQDDSGHSTTLSCISSVLIVLLITAF